MILAPFYLWVWTSLGDGNATVIPMATREACESAAEQFKDDYADEGLWGSLPLTVCVESGS